ncbi:MAG TPA: FAD-linked oxidase C-terminal domain-containing protein [Candidatus Acidoferrales bacterium]|nr:FAD-linked oxidase C-terminal domain-containing protein [Candidatus Acidoferrales bacterium]
MLQERLVEALGADAVKTAPEDLRAYAFDAYTEGRLPSAVVLPEGTREVSAVVKIARDCSEPIVPRGAGTGLCGGAVPVEGGIVISFARMNRVLAYEPARRRACVQPGVINLELSHATARDGLFYAPDPSSQKISTIGGNIATNAGGPHCLSYGTTMNHVLALEIVDDCGEVFTTDIDRPGYDLTAAFVGSEGTLGLITAAWVRLMRLPEATCVWLATFPEIDAASDAVSAIVAAGIVPTALEMMDATATRAVEAAFAAGYPTDAGAVLLIEHAGLEDDMQAYESEIARIAKEHGANSWRVARSQAERDALWAGRKGAAGAMGRIAPNYYLQDVTVRRSVLPQMIHTVERIAYEYKLTMANVFHAGDGNLHPLICYDKRDRKQVEAVIESGSEILRTAVELGGTVSGEHGIGYEKRDAMTAIYTTDDLAAMARVREVFNPKRVFNPEKIFPAGVRCPEVVPVA